MSDTKQMRLAKAALVYNVSVDHIIEALRSQNIQIERTPTFKLSPAMLDILDRNFSADKAIKQQSNDIKNEPEVPAKKVLDDSVVQSLEVRDLNPPITFKVPKKKKETLNARNRTKVASSSDTNRSLWNIFKDTYPLNTELELEVKNKVSPGFIFFEITDEIQGSLHVSELNWNFGLSQLDFRNIQTGSHLKVCITGYNDKYKRVYLSRKQLSTIEKPSDSQAWKDLVLNREVEATVFEEYKNKVLVILGSGLFASVPLLEDKKYVVGTKIQVIPVRKIVDQNLVECTLHEVNVTSEEQSKAVVESFKAQSTNNSFSVSEFCLNSYHQLSHSLYWNYFSEEEQSLLKSLFEKTGHLFSKVEKSDEPVCFEFEFSGNAYSDFINHLAPAIFEESISPANYSEKNFLIELSKLGFWYTHFETSRLVEGTEQRVSEKLFSLFNETVSIRGEVTAEGSLKIRNIKAKAKTESLKEKQIAIKKNDVFYLNRPIIFSQYAQSNTANLSFIEIIDNKITAFKLFEIAKIKSLDLLEKQGKDFRIFSNFLESQIDYEIKANDETEILVSDCQLETDIITEGITFKGKPSGEHDLKPEDKISIAVQVKHDSNQSIGIGSIITANNKGIKIRSNIENFDLVKDGIIIKKLFSLKQYKVQLSVLNDFFANKLPLHTFYKVFHDKDGILPPEEISFDFINPVFEGKDNPQTQAVKKAVGNRNILLIQGPPGTGKTTVITEIVKQLVKRGEKVLVTSQTHIAVDNVLERVKGDSGISIARIGNEDVISDFSVEYLLDAATKGFSDKVQKNLDVKIELLNQHNAGKNISQFSALNFELPLTLDLEDVQDFVTHVQNSGLKKTTLMKETLEYWKETISRTPELLTSIFLKNLNVLFGTCIGIATNKELNASEIVFDTVILDEAGKANISETLTAISKARKIILVGDHKQLPPFLDRDRVEYFKKFSKELAEQRTSDAEIKQALGASFFEYLQREGALGDDNKILLSEQHRMHPDIGNFVSQSFYNSELQNGEHTYKNTIPLPEPFDKQIIFIDTSSDISSSESFKDGSYFNEVEAEFITNKIVPELQRNNVSAKSLAIVSPYSKQCERVKELLLVRYPAVFKDIEVATLDSFQGREHDIIIFSFTRSSPKNKVGFLDDARRLNVALSRAKKKLILIGNVKTLTNEFSHYDQYYTSLFEKLWHYASKYGKTYRINELDFRKLKSTYKVGEPSVTKQKERKIDTLIKKFEVSDVVEGTIDKVIVLNQSFIKVIVKLQYDFQASCIHQILLGSEGKFRVGQRIRIAVVSVDQNARRVKGIIKL